MNRREGFKAMNAKTKRDLNYKQNLVSNEDWGKKVRTFLSVSVKEKPDKKRIILPI